MGTALGKIFKTLRESAGLTQREVSDKLGYGSPQLVSNIERGVCYFPVKDFKKIAKLYSIDEKFLRDQYIDEKVSEYKKKLEKSWIIND